MQFMQCIHQGIFLSCITRQIIRTSYALLSSQPGASHAQVGEPEQQEEEAGGGEQDHGQVVGTEARTGGHLVTPELLQQRLLGLRELVRPLLAAAVRVVAVVGAGMVGRGDASGNAVSQDVEPGAVCAVRCPQVIVAFARLC